jgi:Ala-tRNA(Pro) deacylase
LFLKGNSNNYYLYIIPFQKIFDLKNLQKKLKTQSLKFAQKDTLNNFFNRNNQVQNILSLFSLINYDRINHQNALEILIDSELCSHQYVNFHPFRNDASVTINYSDMLKFLSYLNYNYIITD